MIMQRFWIIANPSSNHDKEPVKSSLFLIICIIKALNHVPIDGGLLLLVVCMVQEQKL